MMRHRNSKNSGLYKNWGVRSSSEMFGPAIAFKEKYLKGMDYKRRTWQCCSGLLTICILIFVFTASPKHLDIQLPQNDDLIETPMLRGLESAFDFEENKLLKQRIVEFMLDSCEQLTSYDVLFCHNVVVNGQPFRENCFVLCKQKTFYGNVEISKTDESSDIYCAETYASTKQRIRREEHIVVTGVRYLRPTEGGEGDGGEGSEGGEGDSGETFVEADQLNLKSMESFTKIPKRGQEICLYQHAVDILSGKWLQ